MWGLGSRFIMHLTAGSDAAPLAHEMLLLREGFVGGFGMPFGRSLDSRASQVPLAGGRGYSTDRLILRWNATAGTDRQNLSVLFSNRFPS
uniref:Putative secreted protein n=1 Tax=Anopheles triannulatus TaxID=58253 RepID=A0A2M4B691_9DIPT